MGQNMCFWPLALHFVFLGSISCSHKGDSLALLRHRDHIPLEIRPSLSWRQLVMSAAL